MNCLGMACNTFRPSLSLLLCFPSIASRVNIDEYYVDEYTIKAVALISDAEGDHLFIPTDSQRYATLERKGGEDDTSSKLGRSCGDGNILLARLSGWMQEV